MESCLAYKVSKQKEYTDLIMQISFNMLNSTNEKIFFSTTLEKIGTTINVSRVYLFDYKDGVWDNTYEWTAENVLSYKNNLQNVNMHDMDTSGMLHCLLRGEIYSVADIDEIQDSGTRDVLAMQGIRSVLAVPLYFNNSVQGMFGFDLCDQNMEWPAEYINLIIAIANLLSSAKLHFYMSKSLQNKQRQLQIILDGISDPVYVADMNTYKMLFWNKYLEEHFGALDLKTKKCYQVLQNLDSPCEFCTNDSLVLGDEPRVWHHKNRVLGGEYKVIDQCILWDNNQEARLSIALDITESLRLQRDEILAREASLAKSNFLANMSHEIRTPLNGIVGLNYLAIQENTSEKVASYLDKIHSSSKTLLSIINEILDFSKVEAGKMELENISFDFREVVNNVYDMIMPNLFKKNVNFVLNIDPAIPNMVCGDSLRFSQILFNIVSNADKFTPNGQISLSAKLLNIQDSKIYLQILVQDTGIGMSESQMSKLFVEFTQADSSTTRKYGGTGLGLAICKKIIECMGGTIKLSSQMNKGTCFELDFIFDLVDENKIPKIERLEEESICNVLAGKRILLAEDNEINQIIAFEILKAYKCIVDIAADGIEAVEKVKANVYDLVLMDIQMPNMDGLEATIIIRQDERYKKLPILAMTAHAMLEDYEKSMTVGMNGHVTKPIEPYLLCKKIANLILSRQVDKNICS